MRIISTLACLFLLLLPVAAAPEGTTAYLAARDRYIAQFKARPPKDDPSDMREGRALDDLERRMKTIIPPWQASGFAAAGKLSLRVLHPDLGFGMLDGLAYGARVTEIIVTSPILLQRWIVDHKDRGHASLNVPQTVEAAIRASQFWTFAYGDDNGWVMFGDVPVALSGGTATAQLATDTDSGTNIGGPKYLLVTVQRGDRFFAARQQLRISVAPQPECERARAFQPCYAQYLQQQPQWDAIRNQAQALVDLLH